MSLFKSILLVIIVILFSMPASVAIAQTVTPDNNTETVQVTEITKAEKKKDKKKDEEGDKESKLQIGTTFYLNFLINLATVFILIVFIYYPNYKNKDVFFTYFLFNIAIFLLTYLMNQIKISMGAAFGLFAVFSMLRYRTEGISIKDMTYLFIVIAVGLVSAIQLEFYNLGIINGIIVISTFLLDGNIIMKREFSKRIQYDNIDFIKPENYDKLLEDLNNRTGLKIRRISILKIDFLRDLAVIDVFYYNGKKDKNSDVSRVDSLISATD
ncbi:MAG: DUF4956 domain-containing protein [Bacteroidota bacterium]